MYLVVWLNRPKRMVNKVEDNVFDQSKDGRNKAEDNVFDQSKDGRIGVSYLKAKMLIYFTSYNWGKIVTYGNKIV